MSDGQVVESEAEGTAGAANAEGAGASAAGQSIAGAGAANGAGQEGTGQSGATGVNGANENGEAKEGATAPAEVAGYWPEDWREKMAADAAGGDSKAQARMMRQLERFNDPTAIFGKSRELESVFSQGGLVKIPGEDASEEEVEAYRKQIGVPEKEDDYVESLKLPEGTVLGEDDKPVAMEFAKVSHSMNLTPSQYNGLVNWYYEQQTQGSSMQDEFDDNYRLESQNELKEEWGGAFKRNHNAIFSLGPYIPGGADVNDPNSTMSRLLGGRTSDGRLIGDDPNVVRMLSNLGRAINPVASVMDDGADPSGKSVEAELAEIDKFRRENKQAYFKDEKMQVRERELLEARARIQARA